MFLSSQTFFLRNLPLCKEITWKGVRVLSPNCSVHPLHPLALTASFFYPSHWHCLNQPCTTSPKLRAPPLDFWRILVHPGESNRFAVDNFYPPMQIKPTDAVARQAVVDVGRWRWRWRCNAQVWHPHGWQRCTQRERDLVTIRLAERSDVTVEATAAITAAKKSYWESRSIVTTVLPPGGALGLP